jgi:leader peptidase (prepilin peptidase) / N-methyltransferase
MTPAAFLIVALALIGLTIGSFLNVCIYRIPRGESVVSPPSRCTSCGRRLAAYHNIPVVSWMALGGRCAWCRAPVSARYPAIETLTAVVFALHGLVFEPGALLVVRLAFAAALIVLAFIDLDHRILPNPITVGGVVAGVAASVFLPPGLKDALIGVAIGGGVLWAIGEAYFRLRGIEGMGMGDVKMLGMVGAFLGWKAVLVTLVLASLTGAIVGVAMLRLRGNAMKYQLPFGTFLSAAAFVASLAGNELVTWYLSFYPSP